jgi:MerR family transcriptional regulator/heat shock protein HspR
MARSEDDPKDKPLYMISVAAELTGMHPQTLRVYEQKGLVTPGRSRGNTRLYSQGDIERLNLVSKLTDEGINLAGVVRILDMRERSLEKDREIDKLRERVRERVCVERVCVSICLGFGFESPCCRKRCRKRRFVRCGEQHR